MFIFFPNTAAKSTFQYIVRVCGKNRRCLNFIDALTMYGCSATLVIFAIASFLFLFRHKKHSCSLGNIVLQYAQRTVLVLPVIVTVVAAQRSKQLQ